MTRTADDFGLPQSDLGDQWQGITGSTGLSEYRRELKGSDFDPRNVLGTITQSLDFMGHGASKWSRESSKMRGMLLQLMNKGAGCGVRLLVLNPLSDVCRIASRQQAPNDHDHHQRKILRSLLRLESLLEDFPDRIAVKLYEHPPNFRITIIDHTQAIIGHYRSREVDIGGEDSAESPLLVFDSAAEWSFLSPFQLLFDREWDASKDVPWAKIHEQARKLGIDGA
jgi:hypothetical protein